MYRGSTSISDVIMNSYRSTHMLLSTRYSSVNTINADYGNEGATRCSRRCGGGYGNDDNGDHQLHRHASSRYKLLLLASSAGDHQLHRLVSSRYKLLLLASLSAPSSRLV